MFEGQNHVHAFATAVGTLGGFQAQPEWFADAAQTPVWQILMAAVLVYQGGGGLDVTYSLVVAVLFFLLVEMSKYIKFSKGEEPASEEKEIESPEFYSNYGY
ncbi:hypothetical protein N8751_00505 [bacterium]|nr:hypothetical protein [bacterium]